jgi:hypothetical protein
MIEDPSEALIEAFAAIAHEQWEHWSREVSGEVSPERSHRWQSYWVPYEQLTEEVKEFDRQWARRYQQALHEQFLGIVGPIGPEQIQEMLKGLEDVQKLAQGTKQMVESLTTLLNAYESCGGKRSAAAGIVLGRGVRAVLDGKSMVEFVAEMGAGL